jgi:hypothetical protein
MVAGTGGTALGGSRRITWRGILFWGVLVLCLPLAFVGLFAAPNEYASWGGSGVDCDGPAGIVLAAWPSLIVYGLAALVLGLRASRRRSWAAGAGALLCLLLVAGLVRNIRAANREATAPGYRETCLE